MSETTVKSDVISDGEQVDLYRDTPVRLLGYANEAGESFRALIHVNWVRLSYAVASGYVVADTMDKCYKQSKLPFENESIKRRRVLNTLVDTLAWQSLASVIIPGFTINRICAVSLIVLTRYSGLQRHKAKWATVFVGLGSIPFIVITHFSPYLRVLLKLMNDILRIKLVKKVKPIDNFVDYVMDSSLRKYISP